MISLKRAFRSPWVIFIILLMSILLCEILVMYLLPLIIPKETSEFLTNIADGVLLTSFVAPIVWWVIILPLKSEAFRATQYSKHIFDQSKMGILLLDKEGKIILANKIFEEWAGKKLKNTFFDKNVGDDVQLELGGKKRFLKLQSHQLIIQENEFWTIFAEDIEEQKVLEKKIEDQRVMVVESSKLASLGEMAGGIAHEINTPLALIQLRADHALAQLKKESPDLAIVQKSLDHIDQTIKRIANIVRGLRNFARDGSKDPLIEYSLKKVVEETMTLCREKFYLSSVKVELEIPDDLKIHCRPVELSQVFLNLMSNSFDAIQSQKEKWIKLKTTLTSSRILIEVSDSGHGIPQEVVDKMMTPFFTTKELGKGTGLGLSISKGIVESHHGHFRYDGQAKNTTFIIELPIVNYPLL